MREPLRVGYLVQASGLSLVKNILVKNIIITAPGLMARGEAGSVVTVVSVVLITCPHWHTRSVMPYLSQYLYGALWLYGVGRPGLITAM